MAVFDGAQNLPEQLDSFEAQTHGDWELLASDDGSSDESRAIVADFSGGAGAAGRKVACLSGPGRGSGANFLFLLRQARRECPSGTWLALSDQDDVWLPDRLERGIAAIDAHATDRPVLYCSRTWVTDQALKDRRLSGDRPRPTGFRHALIQNIAGGNTFLLNAAAANLVMEAADDPAEVIVHDWWIYQIVSGAGGEVIHDSAPTLLYRQHAGNLIGANDGWRAMANRLRLIWNGTYSAWNANNIEALRASAHRLTPQTRQMIECFAQLRTAPLFSRLAGLRRLGLYRQSRMGTLAFWVAALLGRI